MRSKLIMMLATITVISLFMACASQEAAAKDYFILAPWMAIWPGVGLSLSVYGFNLFGDGLRDALNPRLRGI